MKKKITKKIRPKSSSKKQVSSKQKEAEEVNFRSLFESAPGAYIVLLPDKNFTIAAVSDFYSKITMTKRSQIVGRPLFEIFPDNPKDPNADGVRNLKKSLEKVLKSKKPDSMVWQKYDIRKPSGKFEVRYWDPVNTPVLDKKKKIKYIIHRVADITEIVRLKEKEALQTKQTQALEKTNNEYLHSLKESEERFSKFTQVVKDYAIFMIDIAGRVQSWNKGAEEIYKYKADQIIGKHISIFYLEKDRQNQVPENNLQIALKNGGHESEGWRIRKDRSVFWADVVDTPIFNSDNKHIGFSVITRDLSSRKKAEEEIKRTNNFLDSVLENIPNMVFVKDATALRFIRFNKAGEKLLGFSRNDLIGKNDYDFFPKEQADHFTSKDMEVMQGDDVLDIPEEQINTNNGTRWIHTRKIPIKDSTGKPLYLLGISEDITKKRENDEQIKQLNAKLTKSVMELELANKELESFSYSVSHDLRAPLRAIRGYTKILFEDFGKNMEEDAIKMMNSIANNAEKMSQLIDDLLAFSHMGKREINFTEVNMTAIAKTSLEAVNLIHNESKAKVTIHELLPAYADNSLMGNVFVNLISNAIKYSSKNQNPIIEISSYSKNGNNIYCVKDNGIGFDMRYYDKLFGVFQRLHSSAEFEGTGVGLALVKRIVTRHGGRVWAEAKPEQGATFYIELQSTNN